ncbi:MAG: sugar transferase [Herpetosiphon sp.]
MFERLQRRIIQNVFLCDIGITLLCLFLASRLRQTLSFGNTLYPDQARLPLSMYIAVSILWATIFLIIQPQRTLYSGTLIQTIGGVAVAVGLSILTFAGLLYIVSRDISRLLYLYFAISNATSLIVFHVTMYAYIRSRRPSGRLRRLLLVGNGPTALHIKREFELRPWNNMHLVGCVNDMPVAGSIVRLGLLTETPKIVVEHNIDEAIFVIQQQDQIIDLSLKLQHLPVKLHMVPNVVDLTFARTSVETLGGVPVINLRESALTESQRLLKRLFDITASALILLLASPAMIIVALLIKRQSPGPIFFWQERIGEGGEHFRMCKFRSMYEDAEKRWLSVASIDQHGSIVHKAADDPRITSIGRRLRRTSLDELPQLFNVLRGDMSLVGPRPEMPYIAATYKPWQWHRFRVPPGMTGWWQVNGRSERPMHLHTEDDLYYIHNYSFWLDIKIIAMTVRAVVTGQGAM